MSNNIKDNMYIGYIIMTVIGFSAIGLYIYKNNFSIQDKKIEDGDDDEKESLLNKKNKEHLNHRRKIISDINTNEIYYPEEYQYGYSNISNTEKKTILEKNKDYIIDIDNQSQQNCLMEIDIEAQNKKKMISGEDEIEIDKNKKTKSNDISISIEDNKETSEIKKEFDWLIVD